jgi:phosphoglycolate phosphatase-like HAD superfamily hydrolase
MSFTQIPLVVYVDVDDTFVRTVGTKRIPIPKVIEHVKQLKQYGAELYCWSSGGAEYAQRSAKEFGIDNCFKAFMPKPNVMIDDQNVADWRLCLEIHPHEIEFTQAMQYLKQLGLSRFS